MRKVSPPDLWKRCSVTENCRLILPFFPQRQGALTSDLVLTN